MWNLLKRPNRECREFLARLEEAADARPNAKDSAELLLGLPGACQNHASACANCRTSIDDLLATRALMKELPSGSDLAGPWFSTRVMAAIVEQESKSRGAESTWMAVPRLASRLTWVSAVLLLVASTWLFERPASSPAKQPSTEGNQETLFDNAQPQASQDDVLVSLLERQQ